MKLLTHKNHRFIWKSGNLETQFGVIKESVIKKAKPGKKIKTHLKKEFYVLEANFQDQIRKLKRGPAVVLPKDIGLILTTTGISKDSTVLDAGTGSGFLTFYLANFVKKVYSYERHKDFFKIAKKNLETLGFKNVILKNKDIYKGIPEKNLDLITLDVTEPWKALKYCYKSLKFGAFLFAYLPTITQVNKFIKESKKYSFNQEKITEIIERDWHVEDLKVRPVSKIISHTAFLVFLRKG